VRELLLGPKRFSDLRARLDGISPSVLSERLARVEELGLARRAVLPPPAASTV
jgi:DNA-binding HxlR family transcriptional regulator